MIDMESDSEIDTNAELVSARAFARDFIPVDGVDYRWAYDYTVKMLAGARESTQNIDKKAQHIIAFVAPGSGVLALLMAVLPSQKEGIHDSVLATAGLAIVSLAVSVFFAFRALYPKAWTLGPKAINAVLMSHKYPDSENKSMGHQATAIAASVCYMCLLMDKKGRQLSKSYMALFVAALCFALCAVLNYFFLT